MPLDVHFGDKLVPGLNNAVTVRTKNKVEAHVRLASKEIPAVVTRLDTEIWKVRFLLPKDAKGELELDLRAGPETAKEKRAIA